LVIAIPSHALLFQSVIHSLFVGFYSILLLVTPKLMQELSKVGCVNKATVASPIALSVHWFPKHLYSWYKERFCYYSSTEWHCLKFELMRLALFSSITIEGTAPHPSELTTE